MMLAAWIDCASNTRQYQSVEIPALNNITCNRDGAETISMCHVACDGVLHACKQHEGPMPNAFTSARHRNSTSAQVVDLQAFLCSKCVRPAEEKAGQEEPGLELLLCRRSLWW